MTLMMDPGEDWGECPCCGFEPEIVSYFLNYDRQRVGYTCLCGADVVNGVVVGWER